MPKTTVQYLLKLLIFDNLKNLRTYLQLLRLAEENQKWEFKASAYTQLRALPPVRSACSVLAAT